MKIINGIFLFCFIALLVWMFKSENHCSQEQLRAVCISYNRFTGEWSVPVEEFYSQKTENLPKNPNINK